MGTNEEPEGSMSSRQEQIDTVYAALSRAKDLYVLGYNKCLSELRPNQIDESGVSLRQYREVANEIMVQIDFANQELKELQKVFTTPLTNQTEAKHEGQNSEG
jgi:hypothetical protein